MCRQDSPQPIMTRSGFCDRDGGGVVGTGVAFITIKCYHHLTKIYARRIESGAAGNGEDLRIVLQDPHRHMDRDPG